jgi:hypothetical protein
MIRSDPGPRRALPHELPKSNATATLQLPIVWRHDHSSVLPHFNLQFTELYVSYTYCEDG